MTRERLENYRNNKEEIREVEQKLQNLHKADSMIESDVVLDYRTGYPRPQAVVGFDHEKYDRKKESYQNLLDRLREECDEVEQWVNKIPDRDGTRRIFRLRFIDGMTQKKVGKKVHLSQSEVSKKISQFLKME